MAWTKNTEKKRPETLPTNVVIRAKMENGDILQAPAGEFDWDHPGDDIVEWREATLQEQNND